MEIRLLLDLISNYLRSPTRESQRREITAWNTYPAMYWCWAAALRGSGPPLGPPAGLEVMVISKGKPGKSTCTGYSAGVMAGSQITAALKTHLERTLESGRGLNQRELVEVLVQEAPQRLQELMNWGIQAKFQNGYLYALGRPPLLGEAIIHCLLQKNRDLGTRFMGDLLVTDLVGGRESPG